MDLKHYFEEASGTGVLSTADGQGRVNVAVYARPHVMEDGTLAFIMSDRLTRQNVEQNPNAAYLFLEDKAERAGIRLSLTKVRESEDPELIARLRRRTYPPEDEAGMGKLRLVYFTVEHERPLVGALRDTTG
ncbi:MAG: pyridoxamine 5'-phosphate oxidase family protein [Polyangiaceae bacterium]|nr:pyridoxamine 5'-phosphate oxidase family protein [Polyangiaceae bacterium]